MNSNEILNADHLDILFDNRNKQYGAYMLRRNYNNRLGAALGICLGLIFLFFFLYRPDGEQDNSGPSPDVVTIRDLETLQPIIKNEMRQLKDPGPQLPVARREYTNKIEIVQDDIKVNDFPTQDDLRDVAPGTTTVKGSPFTGQFISETPGIVNHNEKPAVTESASPMVQREPEFPGGTRAWLGFLNKHLRVPGDLGEGEKKTVLIRFLVAADGSVTGFEVLQSGGNIYDNEVIRVLQKMPKWKPAIQNNIPVGRSFTQPVTFMGVSE